MLRYCRIRFVIYGILWQRSIIFVEQNWSYIIFLHYKQSQHKFYITICLVEELFLSYCIYDEARVLEIELKQTTLTVLFSSVRCVPDCDQEVAGSWLRSSTILSLGLITKSFLRLFSPIRSKKGSY